MAISTKMRPLKRVKCKRCNRRLASVGFKTCARCRAEDRDRQQARRRAFVDKGLCSRCGVLPREKPRKMCRPCLDVCNDATVALQLTRRAAGLCPDCGRQAAVRVISDGSLKQLAHCEHHLDMLRERQKTRVGILDPTAAERVQRWKDRQRAKGNCRSCGRPAHYDPVAGVLRSMCRMHLDMASTQRTGKRKRNAARQGLKTCPLRS